MKKQELGRYRYIMCCRWDFWEGAVVKRTAQLPTDIYICLRRGNGISPAIKKWKIFHYLFDQLGNSFHSSTWNTDKHVLATFGVKSHGNWFCYAIFTKCIVTMRLKRARSIFFFLLLKILWPIVARQSCRTC